MRLHQPVQIFRTNLVRGFWNKEMEIQNKRAVLVQIAPLCISQPRIHVKHTVQEGTDISASTFKTGLHMPSRNHTVSTAHTYTPHRTHRVSKICLGGMAPVLMLARERRA